MLVLEIFELHKPVRIMCANVTANQNFDDIIKQITANRPDVTIIEIFYQDNENIIDIATFYDGYIYTSLDKFNRAFQLMREAANT